MESLSSPAQSTRISMAVGTGSAESIEAPPPTPMAPIICPSTTWLVFPTDDREIANHDGATGGFCSAVVLSNAFTPTGVSDIGVHLLNPKLPLANIESPKERTHLTGNPTHGALFNTPAGTGCASA